MKFLTSDEIFPAILELVEKTKEHLRIASAWIKGKNFETIVDRAREKGLKIEVILRSSELKDMLITDDRVFSKVREAGGKVYLCSRLHAKFVLGDKNRAVVGSANLTDAGLSDINSGNIEAGIFYSSEEDEREIEELLSYFEKVKRDYSLEVTGRLVGFTLNPMKSRTFEFIALEDISEHSYVEVLSEGKRALARITSLYCYDMGFFANPFTSYESPLFAPLEDFKKVFFGNKDKDWQKGALYSYLSSSRGRVSIATAQVVGVLEGESLEPPTEPMVVGSFVFKPSEEILKSAMRKNSSGKDMEKPVRIGVLEGSETEAFIDLQEVVSKHLLVIGTTGSGKSHFVKKFLCNLFETDADLEIFVLDPHGEYYDPIVSCLGEERVSHVVFGDTLFPIYTEEVVETIKSTGYENLVSGNSNEARNNRSKIQKVVKPSVWLTGFAEANLEDLLSDIKPEVAHVCREIYGSEAVGSQKETLCLMLRGIFSEKKVTIFDFRKITDPQTRINIAGLVMQELFRQSKEGSFKRLLVLEEAHNFAPEKGYGDVSAGRENLSLTFARKIASEGRKFNLGLIAVTQRPAQVSKYVLSQMNSQVMFRTTNTNDLSAISTYVESAGEETLALLPTLRTGTAVVSGLAVPFPVLVHVES